MTKMTMIRKQNFNPKEALYKTLEASVSDTAKYLTMKAKAEAPERSGLLKSSIYHSIEKLKAMVAAWAHYAPYVEYGTMFQSANPFFRRALQMTERMVPVIIAKNVRRFFK